MSNDIKWMIRTKHNHLLGPISKSKLLELLDSKSLDSDDELCAGNGYWFKVKESEYIDRFVKGAELQGFNPVSEALSEERQREEDRRGANLDSLIEKTHEVVNEDTKVIKLEDLNNSKSEDLPSENIFSDEKKVIIEKLNKKVKKEEVVDSKAATLKSNVEYKKLQRARIEESEVHYPFWSRIIVVRTFLIIFLILLIFLLYKGVAVVDIISSGFAQDFEYKKSVLMKNIELPHESSGMIFKPQVSMKGFFITSSFVGEKVDCDDYFAVEREYYNYFAQKKTQKKHVIL